MGDERRSAQLQLSAARAAQYLDHDEGRERPEEPIERHRHRAILQPSINQCSGAHGCAIAILDFEWKADKDNISLSDNRFEVHETFNNGNVP